MALTLKILKIRMVNYAQGLKTYIIALKNP